MSAPLESGIVLASTCVGEYTSTMRGDLQPITGPTYADFVESRRRWIAGEEVTPTAIVVGSFAVDTEVLRAVSDKLSGFEYTALHWDESDVYFDIDAALGPLANTTRNIHSIVQAIGQADALRRGVIHPNVKRWTTTGGRTDAEDGSQILHVEDRDSSNAVLTYLGTSIGNGTGFRLKPTTKDHFDKDGNAYRNASNSVHPFLATEFGMVAVTLLESHTPHVRPPSDGSPRLFTALDITEGET